MYNLYVSCSNDVNDQEKTIDDVLLEHVGFCVNPSFMLKSYRWVGGGGLQDFSVSPGSGSLSLSLSKSLSEPE